MTRISENRLLSLMANLSSFLMVIISYLILPIFLYCLYSCIAYIPCTRNCKICACLVNDVNCTVKFPVYLITCLLCQETYVGESSRSIHDRLSEHLRFATSPDNRSYRDEAFAIHYRQYHHGQAPQLSFKLLKSEYNTVSRKIIEAMYINQLKPEINDKEECISINRFLVKN